MTPGPAGVDSVVSESEDVAPAVRVLLVDDHELVRRGIETVLVADPGIEIVGEAADGEQAVALAGELQPDVVVMDTAMPVCDGIDATSLIRRNLTGVRVIVLADTENDDEFFAALRAGATGFLLKDAPMDDFAATVRTVAEGGAVLAPTMAAKLLARFNEAPRPVARTERLTVREREVVRLLARGLGNREIADELFIAENTVKNHVRAILEKLGVRTRTEAAMLAARDGLVKPAD